MASIREQILSAVASTLAATSGVSGRVYRSRQEAFSRRESPSVIAEPGPASSGPEPVSTCKIAHVQSLAAAYNLPAEFITGLAP